MVKRRLRLFEGRTAASRSRGCRPAIEVSKTVTDRRLCGLYGLRGRFVVDCGLMGR